MKLSNGELNQFQDNKGQLIFMKGFLTANTDRSLSASSIEQTNLISVLFEIECNDNLIFADITQFTKLLSDQKTILFDFNATFRIENIEQDGRGKGIVDAISAQMKRKMNECISFNSNKSYDKALDFAHEIESSTSIKLFIYDQSNVDEIKQQLPCTLQTVKGTAELHGIIAEPSGLVFGKKTSDQPQL